MNVDWISVLRNSWSSLLKIKNQGKALLFCLFLLFVFSTVSPAQNPDIPPNTAKNRHSVFAYERVVLRETEGRDGTTAINFWMAEMVKRVGGQVDGYICDNIEPIIEGVNNNLIDVVNVSPLTYLRNKEKMKLIPAYAPVMGGKKTRKYLLIVRSDSIISSIGDLKSKKLAVMKGYVIGRMFVDILLLRNFKKETETFFSSIDEKEKFAQAILSVFFGQEDACLTTDTAFKTVTELNPQIGRQLKVIAESPEIINMIGFFNKSYDHALREKTLNTIFTLGNSTAGRQILLTFRIDGFVPAQESDLESLENLLNEYDKLKRNK